MSTNTFDGSFVEVYSKTTKDKQTVPAEWLDHPVLGKDFELTPSGRQQLDDDAEPNMDWTIARLRSYATDNGIELDGVTLKDEIFSKIDSANQRPVPGQNEGA